MPHNALDDVMEFDHVIRINPDHSIDTHPEPHIYAPESVIFTDEDGQISADDEKTYIESIESQGWHLLTGFTGQYGYSGPIMHASEYIGGYLAEHIMDNPGLYVSVTVECIDDPENPAGWAVAYRLDTDETE